MPKTPDPAFTAVLVAGGRSSRMGRDKGSLIFEGQPLWRRQLDTLTAAGAEEIFIAGNEDPKFANSGYPVLSDRPSGIGPLGAVIAGLENASCPRVLFLAVDLPLMSAAFLRHLAAQTTGEQGAVPQTNAGLEPLAAIYPRSSLPVALACAESGIYTLREFARRAGEAGCVRILNVPPAETGFFRNLNTPEDAVEVFGKKY